MGFRGKRLEDGRGQKAFYGDRRMSVSWIRDVLRWRPSHDETERDVLGATLWMVVLY